MPVMGINQDGCSFLLEFLISPSSQIINIFGSVICFPGVDGHKSIL